MQIFFVTEMHPFLTEEQLVEMSNGCICCTLREDLLKEVSKLAKQNRFDHLVIESTGVSEPMPVAETFTFEDEEGASLGDIAQIDTMVTVVDAPNFLHDFETKEHLVDRGQAVDQEDERTIVNLLTDQIDFADVILVNKTDLVSPEEIHKVHGMIRALNPSAEIHDTINSEIAIGDVLGTGKFNQDLAAEKEGWLESLLEQTPETEEYGIGNFVYERRIPFHPQRFYDCIQHKWPGVIRSKGVFWLASRLKVAGYWSQAGSVSNHQCGGYFWAALPRSYWPEDQSHISASGTNKMGIADKKSYLLDATWIMLLLPPCSMNVSSPRKNYLAMKRPGIPSSLILFPNGISVHKPHGHKLFI